LKPNLRREDWILDVAPAAVTNAKTEAFPDRGKCEPVAPFESPDWKRHGASPAEIDVHYFHEARRIDVDATPEQLKALFDRLQHQWETLSSHEPFWSVLTHESYKRANFDAHKRSEFYATGYQHAHLVELLCERTNSRVQRGLCVELGCGVGRITKHLAQLFDHVIAIDISQANLDECKRMAEAEGLSNVETFLLHSVSDLKELPNFDFLFSLIVLQHDPPPVQKFILDLLLGKISRGGGFLVQTQTFDADYQFNLEAYLAADAAETMEMHSLPMHHVMTLAKQHGFTMREVLTDNITGRFGSHTFFAIAETVAGARFKIDEPPPKSFHSLNEALKDDLKRLGSQLHSDHLRQEIGLSLSQDENIPQNFWQRLNSYLNSFKLLTRTRRRVEALERNLAALCESTQIAITTADEQDAQLRDTLHRNLIRLDDYQSQTDSIFADHREKTSLDIEKASTHIQSDVAVLETKLYRQAEELSEQKNLLRLERATRQKSFGAFDRKLSTLAFEQGSTSEPLNTSAIAEMPGLQSLLESFYFLLEERYRGSRDEIKQRLSVYRQDFERVRRDLHCNGPIIDLGCGRGELLEVLREQDFNVIGIDQNDLQLDAARQLGLPVINDDALAYLKTLEDESVLAITGIHIAEHLPFPVLVSFMQEIVRVLKRGGLLLFETPNPRNLIVGANTFHFDPTHIKPLPPEVLEILFETCGFINVDVRALHPSDSFSGMVEHKRIDPHIAELLFGPQDYAVVGMKA